MLCRLKTVKWYLLVSVMMGCSTIDKSLPDHQVDYKKSTTVPPLEIPPDLIHSTHLDEQMIVPDDITSNTTTSFSDYNNESAAQNGSSPSGNRQEAILPRLETVQIKRDGNTRWLVLSGEPETLWPKVKQFWLENGFKLKIDKPRIGIMETEWAENRADIPQEGIRKYLGKVLDVVYSASTRDKFRVRLERGSVAGTTELYLTHRGAEEVSQGEDWVWQGRPSDPELEAELLNRLMIFLGIEAEPVNTLLTDQEQPPPSRAELTPTKEGQLNLVVKEAFAQAWQRTGIALDRAGFTVEDRDRDRGVYFIRYIDSESQREKGFFKRWFGKKSAPGEPEEYLISLIGDDEQQTTRIVVLNNEGKTLLNQTAEQILTLLHEQLK